MIFSTELRNRLKHEYGIYAIEAWERYGMLVGRARFIHAGDRGVWCGRNCRDGKDAHAPGTCRACASLAGLRRGTKFCSEVCSVRAPETLLIVFCRSGKSHAPSLSCVPKRSKGESRNKVHSVASRQSALGSIPIARSMLTGKKAVSYQSHPFLFLSLIRPKQSKRKRLFPRDLGSQKLSFKASWTIRGFMVASLWNCCPGDLWVSSFSCNFAGTSSC
jgi:hypothetical protein